MNIYNTILAPLLPDSSKLLKILVRIRTAFFPGPSHLVKSLVRQMAIAPGTVTLEHNYDSNRRRIVEFRFNPKVALAPVIHLTATEMWVSFGGEIHSLNRAEKDLLLPAVRQWCDWSVLAA